MVLFLKKLYKRDRETQSDQTEPLKKFETEVFHNWPHKNWEAHELTILPILSINWDQPYSFGLEWGLFQLMTLEVFYQLCVNFCKAEWGTKEEFITKALCCFWNRITSVGDKLETLENGILDIGKYQGSTLKEGNRPLYVLLFSVGILYPTIQEKIRARGASPFQVEPSELERDFATLDPNRKRFIDKIRTLLLSPEEAIKNLEEVDLSKTESFPCIRAKHPQFSGSCTVKI